MLIRKSTARNTCKAKLADWLLFGHVLSRQALLAAIMAAADAACLRSLRQTGVLTTTVLELTRPISPTLQDVP